MENTNETNLESFDSFDEKSQPDDNKSSVEQNCSDETSTKNSEEAEAQKEGEDNVLISLHESLAESINIIYKIHNICYDKLKDCYGGKNISLPIDIERVVGYFGLKIGFDNLNYGSIDKIDHNIAQLCYEKEGNNVVKKIIVDNSNTPKREETSLSNLEKYAVAYELGKTIIRKENEDILNPNAVHKFNLMSRPYALPRLSAQLENFEYELCAIFLLLPLELFFKEFKSYLVSIKDHPVMMDNWIQHLSQKAEIPRYQLINGYQYIKFGAYQYYKQYLAGNKITGEDYRYLYNL